MNFPRDTETRSRRHTLVTKMEPLRETRRTTYGARATNALLTTLWKNGVGIVAAGVALVGAGYATPPAQAQSAPSGKGAELFIRSARNLDLAAETVTLPLFKGRAPGGGGDAWYVITESSDRDDAEVRGVNPAPKLMNALGTAAVQTVAVVDGLIQFSGTVDFSPERIVVPSRPDGFPPLQAEPGAVGDGVYSPLITLGDGIVLNASQIANATGLHDSVVAIDYAGRSVTLRLLRGFYDGHRIIYLWMDSSLPLLAAIEASNVAPNPDAAPGIASDDPKTSAREAIIPIVNGPRGVGKSRASGIGVRPSGRGRPAEHPPGRAGR